MSCVWWHILESEDELFYTSSGNEINLIKQLNRCSP
jgi:hypothetical protein